MVNRMDKERENIAGRLDGMTSTGNEHIDALSKRVAETNERSIFNIIIGLCFQHQRRLLAGRIALLLVRRGAGSAILRFKIVRVYIEYFGPVRALERDT